jgi:hypothetical protein
MEGKDSYGLEIKIPWNYKFWIWIRYSNLQYGFLIVVLRVIICFYHVIFWELNHIRLKSFYVYVIAGIHVGVRSIMPPSLGYQNTSQEPILLSIQRYIQLDSLWMWGNINEEILFLITIQHINEETLKKQKFHSKGMVHKGCNSTKTSHLVVVWYIVGIAQQLPDNQPP